MTKELYLAGGCFWGLEAYFQQIEGIESTSVGYANGYSETTNYQVVALTDHAETLRLTYKAEEITLQNILEYYFRVIDPTSVNKQGNDIGRQYRTGIYYTDTDDQPIIKSFIQNKQAQYNQPIRVEAEPLKHYIPAESYHQDYLHKNPNGYCHIDLSQASIPLDTH